MFRLLGFQAFLLLHPVDAWAACAVGTRRAEAALSAQIVFGAFKAMNREELVRAGERVEAVANCLGEPLQPEDAAGLHAAHALTTFLAGSDTETVISLYSALQADPAFDFPTGFVPAGHPLLQQLRAARSLSPGPGHPLSPPAVGVFLVDGRPAVETPLDRPFLLQWVDGSRARESAWIGAGAPLPPWVDQLPVPIETPRSSLVFGVGAGVAAIASGVLLGIAAERQGELKDPAAASGDLAGLREQANGLTLASGASAVFAVGLGAVAVIRW